VPYLVSQGYSRSAASAVLMISVASGVVASPVVGALFGRHRAARVPFALGVAFVTIAGWSALVFGFGGQPPRGLLLLMVAFTAVGGPASGIGFSLARDYNERALVGTASGVVNVGGFTASILAAVGVGRVLDLVGGEDAAAFRLAFTVAIAVQAVGAVLAVRWYRRLRARVLDAQERGEEVPVPAVRHRWDLAAW
jgi:Na+/melibiose symporter-like transporter